jgi:hypothetical protein
MNVCTLADFYLDWRIAVKKRVGFGRLKRICNIILLTNKVPIQNPRDDSQWITTLSGMPVLRISIFVAAVMMDVSESCTWSHASPVAAIRLVLVSACRDDPRNHHCVHPPINRHIGRWITNMHGQGGRRCWRTGRQQHRTNKESAWPPVRVVLVGKVVCSYISLQKKKRKE